MNIFYILILFLLLSFLFAVREYNKEIPPTGLPTDEVYHMFFTTIDKEKHSLLLILDEVDSGLDVDALRVVAATAVDLQKKGKGMLVITHYARLLHYLKPDYVHVMVDGKIVKSGGPALAQEVEEKGYKDF